MKTKFPERLKELREEKNLSQLQLGKQTEINYQNIQKWEKGDTSPSIDMLFVLCKFFNCTADYLIGLVDN